MSYRDLLEKKKPEFESIVNFYKSEISNIRTGRANPALVEDLVVEIYGSKYRIQELASISAPETKSLIIQPWDKQSVSLIESAIKKSNLGLNPVVDGQQIRLNFPSLTEERRRGFIKLLKQKTEEAKVKIRKIRENIWDEIQDLEEKGQIREDDKFRAKDELQKTVDDYNRKTEELEKKKEKELLMN